MIKEEKNTGINFFQRYLTVWVFLCMIVGVLLGHFAPALPAFSPTGHISIRFSTSIII